jgi:hypothetical protein
MGLSKDFNDIDKALVDSYEPKLTEQFNELARQLNRVENDPRLQSDSIFLNEVNGTIETIESLSKDFLAEGGTEDEFMLIVEKVGTAIFPAPKP